MSDFRSEIRADVSTLRNNLLRGIRDNDRDIVDRGFDVYKNLIEAVAAEYGAEPRVEFDRWSSPEWRWLEDDLGEIRVAATAAGGRVTDLFVSFVLGTALRLVRVEQPVLGASLLGQLTYVWQDVSREQSAHDIRDHILVCIENFASIVRSRSDDDSHLNNEERQEAYEVALLALISLLHYAAIEFDLVEFKRVRDYLSVVLPVERSAAASSARELASAGLLAVGAWTLMRDERGGELADRRFVDLVVHDPLVTQRIWQSQRRAFQELNRGRGRWDQWEQERNTPGWSAPAFASYLSRFVGAVMLAHPPRLDRVVESPDVLDEAHAMRIRRDLPEAAEIVEFDDGSVERVDEQLSAIVTRFARTELDELIEAKLRPDRIRKFTDAVNQILSEDRELFDVLGAGPAEQILYAFQSDPLLVEILVPKAYFVETSRMSSPMVLAESLAHPLRVAEDDFVIERLTDEAAVFQSRDIEEISARLSERITTLGAEHCALVCVNSYLLFDLMQTLDTSELPPPVLVERGDDVGQVFLLDLRWCGHALRSGTGRTEDDISGGGRSGRNHQAEVRVEPQEAGVDQVTGAVGEPLVKVTISEGVVWWSGEPGSVELFVGPSFDELF